MDTVTHVLFGALTASALTGASIHATRRTELRDRVFVAALAAAFPDIDYVGFWIDPLRYLAEWHRSLTHSVILLPLWAGVLGALLLACKRFRGRPDRVIPLCALGLSTHIFLDLLEVYGTKLWFPLSEERYSLATTFVVDPIATGVMAASALGSWHKRSRRYAVLGLCAVFAYFGFQGVLKAQALGVAEDARHRWSWRQAEVFALPRPFSPFHWQLVVKDGNDYLTAALDLLGGSSREPLAPQEDSRMEWISAYRAQDQLQWIHYRLFGPEPSDLAREVWQQEEFAGFRQFAVFPVLDRIARSDAEICVWFTDLRYVIPGLPPPFRYGMCRGAKDGPWSLYRLRYLTIDERQRIGHRGRAITQ